MVDAESLRLREHLSDLFDDGVRRVQVVPDRLFQHDARLIGDQPGGAEGLADRTIQIRRGGEVEHPDPAGVQHGGELVPVGIRRRRINRHVVQPGQKTLHGGRIEGGGLDMLPQRLGGAVTELVVGQAGASGADDAGFGRHLPVAEPVIQCGQQFSQCQVAGGAEHDAIEDGNGNDLRHVRPLLGQTDLGRLCGRRSGRCIVHCGITGLHARGCQAGSYPASLQRGGIGVVDAMRPPRAFCASARL